MDSIELIGYPIRVTNSTVFKHSFITFLTPIGLVDAKINCLLENYKYGKYIDYSNLCQFYLVKTRENWILKDFIKSEKIFNLTTYNQHLMLSDIIRLLQKNCKKTDENFLPLLNEICQEFNSNTKDLLFFQNLIKNYVQVQ
ncbi:MAG: hypothetical protein ACRCXZ_10955 [Patescibacteria group bacterium]